MTARSIAPLLQWVGRMKVLFSRTARLGSCTATVLNAIGCTPDAMPSSGDDTVSLSILDKNLDLLGAGALTINGAPLENPLPSTIVYFSYVTLATLGYGDYTPAGNPGRIFAVVEALAIIGIALAFAIQ